MSNSSPLFNLTTNTCLYYQRSCCLVFTLESPWISYITFHSLAPQAYKSIYLSWSWWAIWQLLWFHPSWHKLTALAYLVWKASATIDQLHLAFCNLLLLCSTSHFRHITGMDTSVSLSSINELHRLLNISKNVGPMMCKTMQSTTQHRKLHTEREGLNQHATIPLPVLQLLLLSAPRAPLRCCLQAATLNVHRHGLPKFILWRKVILVQCWQSTAVQWLAQSKIWQLHVSILIQ
jgi:hypothetical protein